MAARIFHWRPTSDSGLSVNQKEIEHIKQVRADVIRQRDQYLHRIQNPVNQVTGKPLSRDTINAFRKQIIRFNSLVAMHDRHINRLKTGDGT
jgi:hypothetical protein